MLSLADVLELPVVRRALPELITGGVECELRWSHVIEMRDPDDLLKGGELVLTTGLGAGDDPARQADWIRSLIEQGMAALAVELGSSWRAVPPAIVGACSQAGVPVLAFHRAVRFIDITEAVHSAVLHAQFDLLRRGEEIHRRFTELILQGRGAPEILAELAAAVGNPVMLEDAAHALVYYVSGPPGDDLALSAWTDARRAEARGEEPEGMVAVDVRLMGSSWGRLIALALDKGLDAFDRVAVERAALAVAIDLLGQQHDEQLRSRSRGALLSDLADGRVADEADARRRGRAGGGGAGEAGARGRAEALGFGSGRGALLPVVATWRVPGYGRRRGEHGADVSWTHLSGDLRAALSSTGFGVLMGPRDIDLLILLSIGPREYDAALAEHVAHLFHGALDRHGLGPDEAPPARGRPAGIWGAGGEGAGRGWVAAGQALRRVRRSAGAATALPVARWHDARRPGVADLLHDLRDTPELEAFVDEQLGPLLSDPSPRTQVLLETLEAYLAAGGRKAEAARALHLERQSLYLRLKRIEEALGVSLDDEDVVLGLHLAVRARRLTLRRSGRA